MKKKTTLKQLTKAEEEVMQALWKIEKGLVRDIMDALGTPDVPHSTISSVVRILEKKGFVGHKAYGKTHEYFALVSKEAYAQNGVQSLMEKYFGGSPKQLVSYLVKSNELNLKELNDIIKIIDQNKTK
jgi:BlaI family transcriptional regulator, penicillinase repressor